MITKYELRGFIWRYKRILRENDSLFGENSDRIREIIREIKFLESSAFNGHRVEKLNNEMAWRKEHQEAGRKSSKELKVMLSRMMMDFDKFESTDHELAQILNISHIAYGKFLEKHPKAKGSLHTSAFMHAEVCTENESFIGEKGFRDHPLFDATQDAFFELLTTNKEFKASVSQSFDEVFGAIPRYKQVINPDGTESFERMPPKLTVVEAK